jgi:ribonuclease HI
MYTKTKDFFDTIDNFNYATRKISDFPPWLVKPIKIDFSLASFVSKKEAPLALLAIAKEKLSHIPSNICVYTDASKSADGTVGIGIFIANNDTIDHELEYRLTDGASVYLAELTAIKKAVEIFTAIYPQEKNMYLCSDSLSGILSLRSPAFKKSSNVANEIYRILYQTNLKLHITWVPSHIGIPGNECADKLAAKGAKHKDIDIHVTQDLSAFKQKVKSYIDHLWQLRWSSLDKGDIYHKVSPNIYPPKMYWSKRKDQITSFKLRLDACGLNNRLQKMDRTPSPNCKDCNEIENLHHFLIGCKSKLVENLKQKCQIYNFEFTIEKILNEQILLQVILKNIDRKI